MVGPGVSLTRVSSMRSNFLLKCVTSMTNCWVVCLPRSVTRCLGLNVDVVEIKHQLFEFILSHASAIVNNCLSIAGASMTSACVPDFVALLVAVPPMGTPQSVTSLLRSFARACSQVSSRCVSRKTRSGTYE